MTGTQDDSTRPVAPKRSFQEGASCSRIAGDTGPIRTGQGSSNAPAISRSRLRLVPMDQEVIEDAALPDYRTYTSMSMEGEAAVGRIAIWAAWLEQTLAHFCSALINGSTGVGTMLTEGMTASQLIQTSKKLALSVHSPLSPELKERVVKVLANAKQALEQRNKILHASVGGTLTPGTTAFYGRRLNANGQIEAAVHSPDELDVMGAKLHASMEEVWECMGDVEHALGRYENPRA